MKFKFLRELKRRRVLHTASLYVVGAWIALQVVEVLSEVGLPPSTMRNLLVLLSVGFPVALIVGWFFDISKEGIIRTRPLTEGEVLPELKFFDHLLLAGLMLVVVIDVWVLTVPTVIDTPQPSASSIAPQRTVAVLAFKDLEPTGDGEEIGEIFADELRRSLTRIAGIRVLGPETSKALGLAGEGRLEMARELLVTAFLLGDVLLDGDRLHVQTRLIGVPAGNELWSSSEDRQIGETVDLQITLTRQVVQAIAPSLHVDPAQRPRAEAGACSAVFDIYLRGKQLSKARRKTQADLYQRGMQLLREAVATDEQCALAWEAIAVGEVNWTTPGFAKAGAAARRALELNEALPDAWTVLAEIAEQEKRWSQAEDYFLRALYADPTNAHANYMYSEALLARGRLREALHYALEAYRYEPASSSINYRVALAAFYAGESDLIIKHVDIWRDIEGTDHPWMWNMLAEAHLQKGDIDQALESYAQMGDTNAQWFPDCVRARENPALARNVLVDVYETLGRYKAGSLHESQAWNQSWNMIRCGIWLDQPDLVFDVLDVKGVPPFEEGTPTELMFVNMFHHDGAVMRDHPRFRQMVVDSGLLDYWIEWGWADMCQPVADSFQCD